ncbi:holin [Streptomyces boncukensis]|uniref:Holin n=2 Tax=Streptomyces boncukensis TaxID=2711219 RepID=A0A6G4WZR6_9ACTN|nr:holin [Streptomyces boncukensis]NGO70004.1 holin [Streptomyces boncukensis]
MTTTAFWKATAERMIRTFAQALIAALGLDTTGVLDAPWGDALSLAGGAALLALLTAIATSGGGTEGPGVTESVRRGG